MVNPIKFVKETYGELKKVVWPSRKQSISHTAIVIGVTIAAALFLAALDYGLTKGVEALVSLNK